LLKSVELAWTRAHLGGWAAGLCVALLGGLSCSPQRSVGPAPTSGAGGGDGGLSQDGKGSGTGGAIDGSGGAVAAAGAGGDPTAGSGGAVMPGTGGGAPSDAGGDGWAAGGVTGAGGAPGATIDGSAGDVRDGAPAGSGGAGTRGSGGAGSSDAGGTGSGGAGGTPTNTLRAAASASGRLVGAAIAGTHLTESAFVTTAGTEFNYLTPENEMKWDATEPESGQFTFAAADNIVNFGVQHAMQIKGHNLVWYQQLPAWVTSLNNPADVQAAMINHITQLVTHFRGKVIAWDVVNEAWSDDGGSLRSSVFDQYLGSGFIDQAFQAARAADPTVHLYYNDYGAEGLSAKAAAVYAMVQSMKARGVPIDGVGLQMHVGPADSNPSAADLAANMQRLVALGLEVVISELDVQICSSDFGTQQTRYHSIVAACMAEPGCKAVTVWGVPDKYSWLDGRSCATPLPLLFDDNYTRKPAYTGAFNAFLGL
jgi:endo-1,4-beta-xylanase